MKLRTVLRGLTFAAATAFSVSLVTVPYAQAEDCPRGKLDKRFCDRDGDLVADTPTDPGKLLDPDTLVFSYTPVEDPSVYENVFVEFMDYLSKKTGKKVKWFGADSYAAQVEAMRSGRLHVAGISTGPTVYGVNLAGYVPVAIMGKDDGRFGYKLQLITHKTSDIKEVKDMKSLIAAFDGNMEELHSIEFEDENLTVHLDDTISTAVDSQLLQRGIRSLSHVE